MAKEHTLRNIELMTVINSLAEFMQYEMPIDNIGWNLKRNMNKLQSAINVFGEYEKDIISKYAVKIEDQIQFEDNGQPKIYPAKQSEFKKEHTELLNCETTIDVYTIKLTELLTQCKKKNIDIKPSLLFNLDFMIEDDLEEQTK